MIIILNMDINGPTIFKNLVISFIIGNFCVVYGLIDNMYLITLLDWLYRFYVVVGLKVIRDGKLTAVVESEIGVVAADDGRCSDIGRDMLVKGGHAVDAAVATCLCLGVVYPMSSGIGGGAFMVVLNASDSKARAINSRETAPKAAFKVMYATNLEEKSKGARSMGVPGEIAGLHKAWSMYGKLDWPDLFQPAIKLARDGFVVSPFLGLGIIKSKKMIDSDPNGLGKVFSREGR
ncbi:hypothetical protein MKX03_022975, partial [Papaver bracteatum]